MRRLTALSALLMLLVSAPASAWDPIRDLSGTIRRANSANVARLVKNVDEKQTAVEAAIASGAAAELVRLAKEKAEAEAAVLEAERQIRIQIEERAAAKIESELAGRKSVPYPVDRIAYIAVGNALYSESLEFQPAVYENYVFLTLDPYTLQTEEDGQLILRMIVYWRKGADRLTIRYAALEKRLRSPQPRLTAEPRLQALADGYVEKLASTLSKGVK